MIYDAACELTEYIPDWYNKINLDILDIESITNCILGQLNIYPIKDWQYPLSKYELAFALNRKNFGIFKNTNRINNVATKIWAQIILEMRERDKSLDDLQTLMTKVFGEKNELAS